jgi:hypothetical protein
MADFNMTPSGQANVTLSISRNLAFTADSDASFPGNVSYGWDVGGGVSLPLSVGSRPYRIPGDGRLLSWRSPEPA